MIDLPCIKITETDSGMIVLAADGYRLRLRRTAGRWNFIESSNQPPFKAAHFDLRYQIHRRLNGG